MNEATFERASKLRVDMDLLRQDIKRLESHEHAPTNLLFSTLSVEVNNAIERMILRDLSMQLETAEAEFAKL